MGRESDAASITVTPEVGVTDEGDPIGAETAQHGITERAGREGGGHQPGPLREMTKTGHQL